MATSVWLSPETEQRLDFLANKTGHTKASLLKQIIESGIEDVEDHYLAAEVLQRVRQGSEPVHSTEQVRAKLELDD